MSENIDELLKLKKEIKIIKEEFKKFYRDYPLLNKENFIETLSTVLSNSFREEEKIKELRGIKIMTWILVMLAIGAIGLILLNMFYMYSLAV